MKRAVWWLLMAGMAVTGGVRLQAQDGPVGAPPQTVGPVNPGDPQAQNPQAPPTSNQGVARVSAIAGSVSTQRADSGEWDAAALNAPLVTGDKISAGNGGRAEVQLDYGDILRIDGGAQANFANLTTNNIQVQLAAGTADYVVLKHAQAASEIDTPNVGVHPRGAGVYRIEVISDSESQVIVRTGEAEISTPQGSTLLKAGQLITVQGTDAPQYKISDAPGDDAWDKWNRERDQQVEASASVAHTSPYYTGVSDLDNYGYWTYVPGYGQVWVPNNQAGWAPYSAGNWVWEPYWGWTWVGYEPWGWAPYHYGRWFWWGTGWAWYPGPVTPFYRPFWAPAYVGFFGFGGGFGFNVGFGFGGLGWFPIGPGDPFFPWWGGFGFRAVGFRDVWAYHGRGVIEPLHPGLASAYRGLAAGDPHYRAGVSSVAASGFGRGGAISHGISATDLGGARAVGGNLPFTPTRASLSASGHAGAAPAHAAATHFFGTPAATGARSLESEVSRQQAGARGETSARAETGVRTPAAGRAAPEAGQGFSRGAAAPSASSEWHSFSRNDAGATATAGARGEATAGARGESAASARSGGEPAGGWQHFSQQTTAAARSEERNEAARGEGPTAERGETAREESSPSRGEQPQQRAPLSVGHPVVSQPASRGGAAPAARGGGGGGHVSGGGGHGGGHGRR